MRSFPPNQREVRSGDRDAAVLYVAEESDLTAFHSAHLREAGYRVLTASGRDDAPAVMESSHVDVVVIGHGLSLADRAEIETAARRHRPKPRVVLLYEDSISQTEQADAVLNVKSEPQHLVQTIRYLLTGAINERSA